MALSHTVLEQSCSKHRSPVQTRSVIPSSADSDASAISGVCVYACTPVLDGSCMPVFVGLFIYIYSCIYMYVYIYVCMYVCMYGIYLCFLLSTKSTATVGLEQPCRNLMSMIFVSSKLRLIASRTPLDSRGTIYIVGLETNIQLSDTYVHTYIFTHMCIHTYIHSYIQKCQLKAKAHSQIHI